MGRKKSHDFVLRTFESYLIAMNLISKCILNEQNDNFLHLLLNIAKPDKTLHIYNGTLRDKHLKFFIYEIHGAIESDTVKIRDSALGLSGFVRFFWWAYLRGGLSKENL